MSRGDLRRLGGLLGPAAVLVLACGQGATNGDAGTGTGSTGSTSTGTSGTGSPGTSSTSTAASGSGTSTTDPGCIPLANITLGIGGFVLDGEAESDHSGQSVSGAGDVNGDGLADVIVGAAWADPDGADLAGRGYVVFGTADTSPVSLSDVAQGAGGFVLDGVAESDHSGWSVSGAGDMNGDGLADVIMGAPGADPGGINEAGRTYVVFGKADTSAVLLSNVAAGEGGFALTGGVVDGNCGFAVSGAGDVNGDGLADVVVNGHLGDVGRAYVVFGKTDTTMVPLSNLAMGIGGFVLIGETTEDMAGWSVSGAGDVDGDGLADIIVGAPWASPNGNDLAGRTYVVFGKANTDPVQASEVAQGVGGFVVDGEAAGDHSGGAVGGAGDMNGDGFADLIVGAPAAAPGGVHLAGQAYVVFGKADTAAVGLSDVKQGVGGFALVGEAAYSEAGRSVAGAGDVNGDGLADVVVGALGSSARAGRTYLVFGKADTGAVRLSNVEQGAGGFTLEGEAENDDSGHSVSGATDVNGDGVPDIIVGAPDADPNGVGSSGRTYVVFGGDLSCGGT